MALVSLKSGARGWTVGVTVASWPASIEGDIASPWTWVEIVAVGLSLEKPRPRSLLSFMPSFGPEGGSFCGTGFLNANLRFGAEAVRVSCSLSLKFLIAYQAEGSIRVVLRNECGLSVL